MVVVLLFLKNTVITVCLSTRGIESGRLQLVLVKTLFDAANLGNVNIILKLMTLDILDDTRFIETIKNHSESSDIRPLYNI